MYLPEKIKWLVSVSDKDGFGVFNSKKIRSFRKSIERLNGVNLYYKSENVDVQFLDKFVPVYEDFINSMSGLVRDIRTRILKTDSHITFRAISLYNQRGKMIGSLIYSIEEDCYTNNYKCFPGKLEDTKLPQSPSNTAEFLFIKEAVEDNISKVSWGTDRNYYGYGASIGLAKHKVETKGLPYIAPNTTENTKFKWEKDVDVLTFLFENSNDQKHATKAILYLTSENIEEKKSKYKSIIENEHFEVETLIKD